MKAESGLDCAERILLFNLPLGQHSRIWPVIPQHLPPAPARCLTHGWTPRQGVISETHHPHLGADFTLDPNSLCIRTNKPSRAAPLQALLSQLVSSDHWSKTLSSCAWQLHSRDRTATHAHIAISNCSIHFLFISSVLQKNWKPCFPWRWMR